MKYAWISFILIVGFLLYLNNQSGKAMSGYYQGPEALQWLKMNKNATALASNRFASTEEATKFVANLYTLGAEMVKIPQKVVRNDSHILREEGGPYADALIVKLPKDPERKKVVF